MQSILEASKVLIHSKFEIGSLKIFMFCFGLLLISSCAEETPPGVLERNRFRDLLIQIHLAEGKMMLANPNTNEAYRMFNGNAKSIYKKYNTDSATFFRSFEFYAKDTKTLDLIYQEVVDTLSLREGLNRMN